MEVTLKSMIKKGKIKSITIKACGSRTAEQFARELGEGNATKKQVLRFLEGELPSWELLTGVLRSPDTTPNGRDWARAILKEIEKATAEPSVDLDVERRL